LRRTAGVREEFSHNDGVWVMAIGSEDGAVRMWDLGFAGEGEENEARSDVHISY
jgi:hypothetical protein